MDDGDWVAAELAGVPNDDTWVQWKAVVEVESGDHMVKVRATDKDGAGADRRGGGRPARRRHRLALGRLLGQRMSTA